MLDRDHDRAAPYPGRKLERELWTRTRTGLGERGKKFDWCAVFGREAKHVVDLGCGNGRWLIHSALARRDVDHVGVELVPPAVRLASLRAGQRGLTNLKLAWGDAVEFILERAEPASLDEVHLYHPQPYFDASKRDRRQLTPAVLGAIHRALVSGGLFVFQTDNPAFAAYARRVVPELFVWSELDGPWPDAPEGRTLREIQARERGLAVVRAQCRRIDLEPGEAARRAAALPAPEFDANRPGYGGEAGTRGSHRRGGSGGAKRRRPPRSRA